MQNDIIIKSLLNLVDKYDNDNVAKNVVITTYQENDYTILIMLTTKGRANKNTPFYFGNTDTFIIKEYWYSDKIVNAEILYSAKGLLKDY